LLGLRLKQSIAYQANSATTPGIVSAHSKPAVCTGNNSARPGFADLKSDSVFCAADTSDDTDQRLIRAQAQGYAGIAAATVMEHMRLHIRVHSPDIDNAVARRLREHLPDRVGNLGQFGCIGCIDDGLAD
jgi:hypothetical protein